MAFNSSSASGTTYAALRFTWVCKRKFRHVNNIFESVVWPAGASKYLKRCYSDTDIKTEATFFAIPTKYENFQVETRQGAKPKLF